MTPEQRPYKPQGSAWELLRSRDSEILNAGPAGTGKSRADAEKLHACCTKYPEIRALIVRKTRASCTDTIMVTFENEVVPYGSKITAGAKRAQRHSYNYPNGSELVVAGFDDPQKVMSSQWDIILAVEAIELTADDWEFLSTRNRNYRMPYQQMIAETNPAHPEHWLYKRAMAGHMRHIVSRHEDNPTYYDEDGQTWTERGLDYLKKLDKLTGSRYTRLRQGLWSVAEGARWPMLDASQHLFDVSVMFPGGIPEFYTKFISVDSGFGAPYCALWHAVDFEGNVYTYKEDYRSGLPADEQAQAVLDGSPESESYYSVYIDPSVWHQDRFNRGVMAREKSAGDFFEEILGKVPRFGAVVPGSRVKRPITFSTLDSVLSRTNRYPNWYIERSCTNLWGELMGAVLDKNQTTNKFGEDLDKACLDHAITSAGYGLHTHLRLPDDISPVVMDPAAIRAAKFQELEEISERNFARKFEGDRSVRY